MANRKESVMRRLNKLIVELKVKKQSESLSSLIWKLEQIQAEKQESKIQPIELFLDVLESIRDNTNDPKFIDNMLKKAEDLYDDMFFLGMNTPEFEKKEAVYRAIAFGNGILSQGFFDHSLFYSFADKELYITLARTIAKKKKAREVFSQIRSYGLSAREYIVDDMSYLTNLLRVADRVDRANSNAGMTAVVNEELTKLQRSNGFYDVDPVKLAQVEQNVREAAATIDAGKDLLEILERKCSSVEAVTNAMETKADEVRRMTEAFMTTKTMNAKQELEEVMTAYELEQKKSILIEKDNFINQVFNEAQTKINQIKTQAKSITSTAAAEMQVLGRDADALIRKVENSTRDDEKIKKILEKTRKD
ncbi:MAG: hypothetical protein J6Z22_08315, partial [Lachnospiraceae bacterium]|nr:hypothetical protein [Lachnospiraceae bacterium]